MNIITITFTHAEAQPPKYIITDRIAVRSDCQPEAWATGKVAGLRLEEIFEPRWWYLCKLDKPLGLTEECLDTDLVPESEIPTLQSQWEAEAGSQACIICGEPATEPETGCCADCSHPF